MIYVKITRTLNYFDLTEVSIQEDLLPSHICMNLTRIVWPLSKHKFSKSPPPQISHNHNFSQGNNRKEKCTLAIFHIQIHALNCFSPFLLLTLKIIKTHRCSCLTPHPIFKNLSSLSAIRVLKEYDDGSKINLTFTWYISVLVGVCPNLHSSIILYK